MRKDDRSPVTVADFAAQAVVVHVLTEALGPILLIAEEDAFALRQQIADGDRSLAVSVLEAVRTAWVDATMDMVLDAIDVGAGNHEQRDSAGHWTLDPIDGTKGFLRGQQYAISLAWIEEGAPLIGVLGCPNLSSDFNRPFDDPDPHGTLYFAVAGEGLYELPADDVNVEPIHIRRLEKDPNEPLRLCESVDGSHTSHSRAERVMQQLGASVEPARLDGQGKYAVVGRGQADIYLRLPRGDGYIERIWDHAAGAVVAQEGGCAVTDVYGKPLDFGLGSRLEKNRGVVVATPELHGRVLAAMGDLATETV